MQDQEAVFCDGLAHDGEIEVPFNKDGARLGLKLWLEDHKHAFLTFGQHHLIRGHSKFALRYVLKVQADAKAALVAHFHGRAGQASGAHVLNGNHSAGCHQFQRGFHQAFFGEGIADLHGGALVLDRVVKFGGCHGRSADAVASGFRAKVHDWHADTGGGGVENLVRIREACGKGVHKAVAVVGRVKAHFAANRWDAKGIAVTANARDNAVNQLAGLGVAGQAEGQRIHRSDRPCAHGEDIAQDAADAGGSPLVGFDIGRVVVAFHLKDDSLTVADIDDACVFTGAADDLRASSGQGAQPLLRGLVGTMLVPHGRKDAQFGKIRRASDDRQDAFVLVRLKPVCGNQVWRDNRILHGVPRQ